MKIIADYHVHTKFSDGKASVDEVVRAGKDKGLVELAITDHGYGKPFGFGVKKSKWDELRRQIAKASEEHGIPVLFGMEANVIGCRGQIDITPQDAAELDILLCGIHRVLKPAGFLGLAGFFGFFLPNWFWAMLRWTPKGRVRKNTETMKAAIMQNDVDVWVHPNRYFRVDVVEVAKTCVQRGTLVELNGQRVSFRPIDFERMRDAGAKFIINSDSHFPNRVAGIERVAEFLKNCEYNEDDIVNLRGTFTKEVRNNDIKTGNSEVN